MEAMAKPCPDCPWRKSNQGKPHPHGWYSRRNLRRLWAGLRSGKAPGMTCHPTDPDNLVPEGHRGAPEGSRPKECAGALLLVQRELRKLEKTPERYLKENRDGLTRSGVAFWALERCVLANTPFGGTSLRAIGEDPDVSREGAR